MSTTIFFGLLLLAMMSMNYGTTDAKRVPVWTDTKLYNNSEVVYLLLIQNMEARLSCLTNLRSPKVVWYKDGQPLEKRVLGKIIQSEHSIKLPGLLAAYDKGNYTCVVSNRNGRLQRTFVVDIIIQHRGPAEFTMVPENRTVTEGENAEFNCRYLSGDPAYVQWVKHYMVNGSYRASNGSYYITSIQNGPSSDTDPGHLTVGNVTKAQSGWYTCIVSNRFGSVHRGAWLEVIDRPPLKLTANQSSDFWIAIGVAFGIVTVVVVICIISVMYVWNKKPRRAIIPFIKSTIYGSLPVTVPDDPNWAIPRENLQVGDMIGEGAFGRVHLGHVLGFPGSTEPIIVAVKMARDGASDAEIQDLIFEMETMKSIGRHINIINFIGYCIQNEGPLLVIVELAPHGNLREYLRKHRPGDLSDPSDYLEVNQATTAPLTTKDLVSFAFQVARGMEYLASKKIVHRDLAARNILVAEEQVLKIADFGLTRNVKEKDYYHRMSNGRVPVKWMALESLTENRYTTKSDVWSFGVLLWEIFTFGSNPYPSVPVENLLQLLQRGHRMEKPQYASTEIYGLMLRCWHSDPSDRPSFLNLVQCFDQLITESAQLNYLNLEIAFDDDVFHEGMDEMNPLTKSEIIVALQLHGSDSQYESMSSERTCSPSGSTNLGEVSVKATSEV